MRIDVNPARQRRLKLLPQPPLVKQAFRDDQGVHAEYCSAPRTGQAAAGLSTPGGQDGQSFENQPVETLSHWGFLGFGASRPGFKFGTASS